MSKKILFKYTSRGRKDLFFRGLRSIVENLANREDYHILCTFDEDDLDMNNDEVLRMLSGYYNLTFYFGTSTSKISAINNDIEKFPDFDVLVNFSDDQIFTVKGFDDIIRKDIEDGFPDGDCFIHYPDGNTKDLLPTMSVMDYKYFSRTNYIYNPAYLNVYCDNHELDIARILGRHKFIDKRIFDHLHPCFGLAAWDEQYQISENPISYQKDRETYEAFKARNFDL